VEIGIEFLGRLEKRSRNPFLLSFWFKMSWSGGQNGAIIGVKKRKRNNLANSKGIHPYRIEKKN